MDLESSVNPEKISRFFKPTSFQFREDRFDTYWTSFVESHFLTEKQYKIDYIKGNYSVLYQASQKEILSDTTGKELFFLADSIFSVFSQIDIN